LDEKYLNLQKEETEMTIYKKDLQALNKDIKALGKKVEKLLKELDKSKKAKSVRTKTTKKVPTKKAPVKKGTAKLTATEKVLRIIRARKRGVKAATLMKKTGFDDKKIRNIVFKAFKEGKIKRAGRGIYIGA
jgi:hypothetical protein